MAALFRPISAVTNFSCELLVAQSTSHTLFLVPYFVYIIIKQTMLASKREINFI